MLLAKLLVIKEKKNHISHSYFHLLVCIFTPFLWVTKKNKFKMPKPSVWCLTFVVLSLFEVFIHGFTCTKYREVFTITFCSLVRSKSSQKNQKQLHFIVLLDCILQLMHKLFCLFAVGSLKKKKTRAESMAKPPAESNLTWYLAR